MSSKKPSSLKSFYKKNNDTFTQAVSNIARQTFYKNLPNFRFGFELETQSFCSRTCDNYRSSNSYESARYDLDAFALARNVASDAICASKFSEVSSHMYKFFTTYFDYLVLERFIRSKYPRRYSSTHFSSDRKNLLDTLLRENPELTVGDYHQWLKERQPRSRQATYIGRMQANLLNYHNGCNFSYFLNEPNPFYVDRESYRITDNTPIEPSFNSVNSYYSYHVSKFIQSLDSTASSLSVPYVEYGTDATVKGPEIRTVGGLSLTKIRESLAALDVLPKVVDSECSFHVHFSVNGVRMEEHKPDFHLALYEGLLNHLHELPSEVKNRISRGSWRERYFDFKPCTNKYTAIAWRHQTWEFRCFGGISSYKDQLKCVMVAAKAFYWACRAYSGKERRFLTSISQLSNGSFYSKAIDRVVRGKTPTVFTSVIRQLRDEGNTDDMVPERLKKRQTPATTLNISSGELMFETGSNPWNVILEPVMQMEYQSMGLTGDGEVSAEDVQSIDGNSLSQYMYLDRTAFEQRPASSTQEEV
jgi:hypothetical protein